jgi:glutamine synthetase
MTRDGFVYEHQLWTEADWDTADDVLAQVRELGLDSIRVSFPDQHGILRGKTLVVNALASAFSAGVAMTSSLLLKDTSHRTVFQVWAEDAGAGAGTLTGARDVIMVLEPSTFKVLPWAENTGWLMGDVYFSDGSPVPFTGRHMLRRELHSLAALGLDFVTGLEVEFHVLAQGDAGGQPALLTHGMQYLTEDKYDRLEPALELVRKNALALGLPLRTLETEFGPSQCEVTFDPVVGLDQADNMVLFRSMVKQVCRRAGFHATFMCVPRYEGVMASGWHLHQSLVERASGRNAFAGDAGVGLSSTGEAWVAGLLSQARESCVFAAPTVNGYRRYKSHGMAPDRVQWANDNKGALLRVISQPVHASRVENRLGEPAANPYLYLLSQVVSGSEGLEHGLRLPPPTNTPYDTDAPALPGNLGEAIDMLNGSTTFRRRLGDAFVDYYVHLKRAEWERYLASVSQWEHDEYFDTF